MKPSSLPVGVPVGNVDAVVAIFGRFDLHDAELRGLRLSLGPDGVALLDADFVVPGEFALATGAADRGTDYRVTLRCTDVSDLTLADFLEQNVVAEYVFEASDPEDGRAVHVTLTCSPGCDMELRCRAVAVVSVQPLAS